MIRLQFPHKATNALLVIGCIFAAMSTNQSEAFAQDEPEPIKCYQMAGELGLLVGQAVELCGGATDSSAVIRCFTKASKHPADGGLGLPIGLAINLCKNNSVDLRPKHLPS